MCRKIGAVAHLFENLCVNESKTVKSGLGKIIKNAFGSRYDLQVVTFSRTDKNAAQVTAVFRNMFNKNRTLVLTKGIEARCPYSGSFGSSF